MERLYLRRDYVPNHQDKIGCVCFLVHRKKFWIYCPRLILRSLKPDGPGTRKCPVGLPFSGWVVFINYKASRESNRRALTIINLYHSNGAVLAGGGEERNDITDKSRS